MSLSVTETQPKTQDQTLKYQLSQKTYGKYQLSCQEGAIDKSFLYSSNPIDKKLYFDTRTLTIWTEHEGKKIIINVAGPGRCETINLFVNDTHLDSKDKGVMKLDRSLQHANMYLLERLSHQEQTPNEHEYSMGIIRQSDNAEKNKDAKAQIKRILLDALSQETLPKIITARLLTNEKHWQLVVINLEKGLKNPKLTIINSTNLTREMELSSIQENYYHIIGETINECLLKVKGTPIAQEDIEYMQGLQYGNMGCGFTTDLNYKKWQSGEFTPQHVFHSSDIVLKTEYEQIILDGETYSLPVTKVDSNASIDRSIRSSKLHESIRRVMFCGELLKHEQLFKELKEKVSLKGCVEK